MPPRRWLFIALAIAILAPADPAGVATAAQEVRVGNTAMAQPRVLVLYATRRDAQIVVVGDRELQRAFAEGLTTTVDYYPEYLDQTRFSDPDHERAFQQSLQLKYGNQQPDLVVAVGDLPLRFATTHRESLFPRAPIVYFATTAPAVTPPRSTGLVVALNLTDTVSLASALQPDLMHVFVVMGRQESYAAAARAQLAALAPRIDVTFLTGLPTGELERRLATLPPASMVFYLSVDRDGLDQRFRPLDYLDRVTAVANAPTYSWVDSTIGHGVVGGSLKIQEIEMRTLGRLAVRVLRGERADSIPPSSPDLNVRQVDWRQLERWAISETRVPVGTVVLFREPSLWDRYRAYVVGAAIILMLQMAAIAGLLVQRCRRRFAEAELRAGQEALRRSYDRIRHLGARLISAQDAERARIARDLHDDLGQRIAVLEVKLETLRRQVPSGLQTSMNQVLDGVHRLGKNAHDLSHALHPAKLRLVGLVSALESLRRERSQAGVEITFTHRDVPARLPEDITLCLFRVAQEGVQNAVRHGGAHNIVIRLDQSDDSGAGDSRVALTIVDDGVGFDVDTAWGHGLGLISMQERIEAIGGTFAIQSIPQAGTRLEVTAPLGAQSAPAQLPYDQCARTDPSVLLARIH